MISAAFICANANAAKIDNGLRVIEDTARDIASRCRKLMGRFSQWYTRSV